MASSNIKGQVVGGNFGEILVRQKSDNPIELGELLIAQNADAKVLLSAYDLSFGSQISQQNRELVSGMQLEQGEAATFFEPTLRNYTLAHLKTVLTIKSSDAAGAKAMPSFFSTVREVTADDLQFLTKPAHGFSIGNLRSGSKSLPVEIFLDAKQVLSHHILIPATTGKGKSNLMSVLLWNLLTNPTCGMLVFDPHDEYFGRTTKGLKDHNAWDAHGKYYTPGKTMPGAISLKIHVSQLRPSHFHGVVDFSQPQEELLAAYYSQCGTRWIEAILKKEPLTSLQFNEGTFAVVQRRIARLLDITITQTGLSFNGIFSDKAGESTLKEIVSHVDAARTVIIDTSPLSGASELLVCSLITHAVFDAARNARKEGKDRPVTSIVLEEAPRVLGRDVLERGSNVFSSIAREGRKFGVGLIAITQLPSLIPKDILANMNTKIVLGIEMAQERAAVIESAAQDLSTDARAIAALDRGEAIVTSNFTRFAIPIKIPYFLPMVDAQPKVAAKMKFPTF